MDMKKILFLGIVLVSIIALFASCDDDDNYEFKQFKINIMENEVVNVAPQGGSFEVFALTKDKKGNAEHLTIEGKGKYSSGDYDYLERDDYKITYNRITRHATIEVYANNTGEKRDLFIDVTPKGPVYVGYLIHVAQESAR